MNTAIRIKDNNLVDLLISCHPEQWIRDAIERNPEGVFEFTIGRAIERCISNVSGIPMCENKNQKGMDLVDGTEVKYGTVGYYVDKNDGHVSYSVTIGNLSNKTGDIRIVIYNPHENSNRKMSFLYIPNASLRPYGDGTISITFQFNKHLREFDIADNYKIYQVRGFADICLPIDVSRKNFKSNKLLVERCIRNRPKEVADAEKWTLAYIEDNEEDIKAVLEDIASLQGGGDYNVDSLLRSPKELLLHYVDGRTDMMEGYYSEEEAIKIKRVISNITSKSVAYKRLYEKMRPYKKLRTNCVHRSESSVNLEDFFV